MHMHMSAWLKLSVEQGIYLAWPKQFMLPATTLNAQLFVKDKS